RSAAPAAWSAWRRLDHDHPIPGRTISGFSPAPYRAVRAAAGRGAARVVPAPRAAAVPAAAARRLGDAAGALARRGAHRRLPVAARAVAGRLADRLPVQLLPAAGGQ